MKSLHEISLKSLAAGLLAFILLILVAEYFTIRHKFNSLQEVDQKSDYVHNTQINSQQIALELQLYLNGQTSLNTQITAQLNLQDHYLKTIAEGGRIDGTELFVKQLSRLEKITFNNLKESWDTYKENVLTIITQPELQTEAISTVQPVTTDSVSSSGTDSLKNVTPQLTAKPENKVTKAKAMVSGEWLTLSEWYSKLNADIVDEKEQNEAGIDNYFIIFGIVDLALIGFVFWLFSTYVIQPIQTLENNTIHQIQIASPFKNEIGSLTICINETIEHLKDATEFVEKIGEGNLSIVYKELDATYTEGKNKLADSLISMQGKLKALNDEEQKRKWSNEGLAKFVDILRSSDDNINVLGDNIISALVKYTGSNQGGLYILNDENERNKHLELVSLFAFDLKKFEKQQVKLGEGILGQTFLERETTYLNEIPEEYIRITSGLGDATPKTILMVPLKVDTEVYGIVELASFREFQPHEIAFVEKLGETIASTLASVKSAQKNRQLIEQFQTQTEQMKAQEEEMRQNMEELQATQEEIARKEREYIARIQVLESEGENDQNRNELIEIQDKLSRQEMEYQSVIQEMEKKLQEKPAKGDDWALATQVEKELKINLEALKITRQEWDSKTTPKK
jgi:GAF domain-containing protein